jgi:HEAT repeat protein
MQAGILAMAIGFASANAQVAELVEGLIWAQPADGQTAVARLLELGEPAGRELCAKLRDPASGEDDSKVRFALEGMVVTVMREPQDPRRAMLANVFAEAMTAAALPEIKSYLIRNLARVGLDEAVPVLAPLLADAVFCEPATQALLHIGSPAAGAALAAALPPATGGERLTLIRALGQLRQAEAVQAVLPLAGDENVQTRLAAWYALANCGIAAVDPALQAGTRSEDAFVASRAQRGRLLLARRLAEAGQGAAGEAIAREVMATPLTPATRQVVCAALATLVDMAGERALPEVLAAVASPDWQVREAALNLAAELPAGRAACVKQIGNETNPDIRAAVVAMLGRTGDEAGKTAVLTALTDPELVVRQAAAQASLVFGVDGMEALLAYAGRAESADDAKAAQDALLQVREADLTVRVGALLPAASSTGKVVMLAVLAARNASDQSTVALAEMKSPDREVAKAALAALETIGRSRDVPPVLEFFSATDSSASRNGARSVLVAICRRDGTAVAPVLAAQAAAEGKVRTDYLGVLARLGGEPALAAVQQDLQSPDADLRNAAVRALAEWQNAAALPALQAVIAKPENDVHRVLALRGYVRLAATTGNEAIARLGQATEWANTAEDKKLVLGALGGIRSEESLLAVAAYLDDEEVREEAAAAAVAIACPRDKNDKGLVSATVAKVLNRVVAASRNEDVLAKARAHLPNLPVAVDGVNIALGKPVATSCNHQGDKEPWRAVDGKLDRNDAWFGAQWPSWYRIDLKKTVAVNAVRVVFYYDGRRFYQYTFEVSTDGETWTQVVDNSANSLPATEAGLTHAFAEPVQARYVRLNILKNSVNEAVHVVEVEVYSADPAAERLGAVRIDHPHNVALGRPVTAHPAHEQDKLPARAVNGVLENGDGWWGGPSPDQPAWLQVDLGEEISIDTVRAVCYNADGRHYTYLVQGSVDGEAWQTLADHSKNEVRSAPEGYVHRFAAATVRYVRLFEIKNSSNPSVHVNELEVYRAGKAPQSFAAAPAARPKAPAIQAPPLPEPDAEGFVSLFNGTDLAGWMGSVKGYSVEDGSLVCQEKGGGMLLTMHRFSDFVLRFEFKMPKGANNGLAIRTPASGNPAYAGMELQIIDNEGYEEVHKHKLQPWQVHGSIYGCVPAKTGALRPVGEWNVQEVHAVGSQIRVVLNGETIVDADLDTLTETADGKGVEEHPGLRRRTGHIGWLGHGARVEFRNIRVKPLEPYTAGPHNVPPEGFTALFNGTDLSGWKGLLKGPYDNPEKRAELEPDKLREHQAEADENMRANWRVEDGALVFSGKGRSLATARDYADFELHVDWKICPDGDSGLYLRGSPQVQIWDPAKWPVGSGGLYNNKTNPSNPSECADNPIGQWNRFFIRMVGEKVTVYLNGVKVVDNVTMENYWNRNLPIFPSGQIELQNHGNTLWFRNIYLREL